MDKENVVYYTYIKSFSMFYTLDLHNIVYQLYLNKFEEKQKKKRWCIY